MAVLGVDVGGTTVKTWREDASGGVAGTAPTPRDDPSGERTARLVADLVRAAGSVTAVGLAVPGIVDPVAGVCRSSVNLAWRDVPIGPLVAARVGVPVVVAHDVRAGATGERLAGAGRGREGTLLFAPFGTGLALAWVDEDGTPLGNPWTGEVGQLRHGSGPHAGLRVEEVASAGGLARRFGVASAKEVLDAREAGDETAARLWGETVEAIAEVIAWSVAITAPAMVVVGGGLVRAGDALLEPLRASLAQRLDGFPAPLVLAAECGTESAAIGMARLAARV